MKLARLVLLLASLGGGCGSARLPQPGIVRAPGEGRRCWQARAEVEGRPFVDPERGARAQAEELAATAGDVVWVATGSGRDEGSTGHSASGVAWAETLVCERERPID